MLYEVITGAGLEQPSRTVGVVVPLVADRVLDEHGPLARADCQPTNPITGGSVTCTSNDSTGYQAPMGVDQLDVDIQAGARNNFV